jgi:ABC-type branched-subunit amino acid transport system permease subunit
MQNPTLRSGISAGITFAVIIIFLTLIGFTVTGSGLIGKMIGNPTPGGQMPSVGYFITLLSLLGIWNGWLAARPKVTAGSLYRPSLAESLQAGLVAGLVTGALVAALAAVYASMQASGTDPRAYLGNVTPVSIRLFLFDSGSIAPVLHLALMTVTGVLGGYLNFSIRRIGLREKIAGGISKAVQAVLSFSLVEKIRRFPYAIFIVYALVALLLFILPRQWGSYWNYIIGTVGIYVIMGLGLNIIVGFAGQLVLGYVAFFAIGAYTAALLTAPQPHNLGWNFWIVIVVGILLSALTGVLLGLPILRLRGDYLAIVTLGFGEIIRIMLRSDLMTPITAGPRGVRDVGGPTLLGSPFRSDVDYMYLIIVAVLLVIFVASRLQNSRTGRAWVAIREDEIAARATGINTFQSKLLALAIGAAFAGLGGVLFASRNQFTGPEDHTLMVSINVLALVIVGGMGSIPGVVLGAFALKGLPEILRELENYRLLVFGALLVVMMILRPEGLWPTQRPNLENQARQQATDPDTQVAAQEKTIGVG